MDEFKTYFNPFALIGRLVFSLFSGGLTCFLFYLLIREFSTNGPKEYFYIILMITLFGAFFQMFFTEFITKTKNYIITDQTIQEFNLLTFRSRTIPKSDIKGFSTSIIPYRIWDFKQVIIYLTDGTKIDLMQFTYFNFKKIKPTLLDKKYNYLGQEPYIWKWFNSRVYKYDN